MRLKHVLLVLALLTCGPAVAATLAERSPFTQGLWWDPTRSGSGFDLFNASGHVMVIWYTYDQSGRPTWYTAQGPQEELGKRDWPLMKHRWVRGRKLDPTIEGTLKLVPANTEQAQVEWQVGAQKGSTRIEPFMLSGVVDEVDHSGTWFDPENSGWGITILEQGALSGAALYTYDPAGEPTWAAGFERGKGSVELFVSNGACPWCPYRAPATGSIGRLVFDFEGESRLTLQNHTALGMAQGIGANGARLAQLGRPVSLRAADRQLARFDAASLRAFLAAGMLNVPQSYGGGDFSAGPPAPAVPGMGPVSTTNLQEMGVDEAALVQSTGSHIFTYAHATTRGGRVAAVRIARVEANGAVVKAAGEVAIGTGDRTPLDIAGLYLHGSNLVSVHGTQPPGYAYMGWMSGSGWSQGLTQVEILDISSPERPVSRWRADIDGHIVASRRVGSKLYVISRFTPYLPGFVFGAYNGFQIAANEEIVARADLDALMPKVRTTTSGLVAPLLEVSNVYTPPQGTRKAMADLVTVTSIDIDTRRIVQALAIAGSVETVYASPTALLIASARSDLRTVSGVFLPEPAVARTDVHQISLGAEAMSIVGSGTVEGYLAGNINMSAFRLSESQGKVRVVSSSTSGLWGSENRNRLTILEPTNTVPGLLKTVSYLPNAQRPQPIGKPGEQLHATRFVGDRLYAVTFKKIDPLYVVDLSNSADPRITGALEIPGFSDYLHPLPNGLLLGFGKDAVPALDFGDGGQFAWYQGLQVALYDVSDAGKPLEKQRLLIGKRGSDSALLQHHHAFSSLELAPGRRRMAIPVAVNGGATPLWGSGPSASYPWQYSGLYRFEMLGTTPADALLVETTPLAFERASGSAYYSGPYPDPGRNDGRSVLFPAGTVFVGRGTFWHQDEQGVVTGPF